MKFTHKKQQANYRYLTGRNSLHSSLHHLAHTGQSKAIENLLQNTEIDVDAYDESGFTPLHRAVRAKRPSAKIIEAWGKLRSI